ncbi:unnamed protein product [Brassicogethes aeneus]|uniref:AT-rich interactive domain-containing protein 2 n=1 Tax=Brassicogethes aeneus TaxID=1431903 RepID=A0A9P0BEU5_BRAAE|nr:unnamed protein product [Brassicogethes aeneus]
MAKILDKDPATYCKERDGFLRDLQHFHETKGTPFKRCPTLGGREVDLFLLYSVVTAAGGWIKVNTKNTWVDILSHFKVPTHCVNASVALKQIYLRYLDRWEKVHFLGEDGERGSDDDEESRHKRWSARALHSVPYTYNYTQHNIAESNRDYNHMSTNLYKGSDYDRLALSLISPLPNEQDFAINVCTLLSNDGKHTLKLEKHPRIINFLLGHAGVFHHESLREIFVQNYSKVRKHSVHTFWRDVVESKEYLDLTLEGKFVSKVEIKEVGTNFLSEDILKLTNVVPMEVDSVSIEDDFDSDCEIVSTSSGGNKVKLKLNDEDDQLFCLKRSVGTQDYIGQRVVQIATILRNLSFIEENLSVLSKNQCFLRFILLCASSQWSSLKNLGLDMLGNLASEFSLKDVSNDILSTALIKIIVRGLESEDRNLCISSLEVLNKLGQNENNEDILLNTLECSIYKKVCSFLTIHDVMLLIYTLECLYSLSSLGEKSCNFIVINHGVIDTLVSLVTVEGKSYGPKACIGMKLVETVTGVATAAQNQQQQQQQGQQQAQGGAVAGASGVAVSAATPLAAATPVKVSPQPATPVRQVQIAPQRLIAVTPMSTPSVPAAAVVQTPTSIAVSSASVVAASSVLTPQQAIQQQHAHQQAIHENEQFALAWLRATYEPAVNGRIDHQELYKHYLNSCSKIGRKGVISPLHFPRCVRSVFGGTVGPNPMKPVNPLDPQYYDGIKAMAHPHLSQALLGTSSATSTTTLTTPTTTLTTPSVASVQQQVAPKEGQSSTSLIKSLLANKVNDCMSTVSMKTTDCQNVAQVAARQQQQRLLAQQNAPASQTSTPSDGQKGNKTNETPKASRLNGARQLFNDNDVADNSVSSTTQFTSAIKGKKEPPQPPPPPLAPLSNNLKKVKCENEDSNNSLSVGTVGIGGISSTEDGGDNSLTSFEGLLNGVPNVDAQMNNEDDDLKELVNIGGNNEILMNKPLRLADLLEKKFEKSPPVLNGALGKDLRLGNRTGLDLVENHIEKALRDSECHTVKSEGIKIDVDEDVIEEHVISIDEDKKLSLKRAATEEIVELESKKPLLSNVNGSNPSNTASTAAAKLFADLAADILEDEDEEQLLQEASAPTISIDASGAVQVTPAAQPSAQPHQQLIAPAQQQPQRIVVSQAQLQSTPIKSGQTVIVNAGQQRNPMLIQQSNPQFLLSSSGIQGLQGQVQLVAGSTPGQYVLQTSGSQGYVVAQPQTAVVHGQQQTVLVAQTSQQQGTGAKTIIILQQQPNNVTQHQKVMVTPQGQQVVVTQVPRPVMASVSTNNAVSAQQGAKTSMVMATSKLTTPATANGVVVVTEKKEEQPKIPKIVRDLTTAFVCEWGTCNIDTKFKSANQVYLHACEAHCPQGNEEVVCQWDRCDTMKRKRFSLMTHLNDKHCNPEAMKQNLVRRKKEAQGGKVEPPAPAPTTPHPGYAPDAALHAIKRHALEFVNPKELQTQKSSKHTTVMSTVTTRPGPVQPEQDDNEGPVTKSIRLTASLILRNLVIYSTTCRRYLKGYESHLANVALSNVESSRTIAQILYDMNENSNHR